MIFVINKTTKQVLRYGYCSFINDGTFLSEIEEEIEVEAILSPSIREQDWFWNSALEQFQITQP